MTTTLKPGVRYNLVGTNGTSPGYLLDNIYIESDHPVGKLLGTTFHYNMTIGTTGELKYKDGIAGELKGMEIFGTNDELLYRLVEDN